MIALCPKCNGDKPAMDACAVCGGKGYVVIPNATPEPTYVPYPYPLYPMYPQYPTYPALYGDTTTTIKVPCQISWTRTVGSATGGTV